MMAAVLHAPGDIRYESVSIPKLGADEVLVRVRAAGVCGSDINRVMVKGTYSFPTIPGHEFSGEVVQISNQGSSQCKIGDRVAVYPLVPCMKCDYCKVGLYHLCDNYSYLGSREDGGFAQFVKVPSWNVMPIPDNVDFETAAGSEPAAVALHTLRRANLAPGDSIAIFGIGPIGLLIAQWARSMAVREIYLIDVVREKLELAIQLGFSPDYCINGLESNSEEEILERTSGKGVSVAIDAAGVPSTFSSALKVAGKLGRVVLLGNPEGSVHLSSEIISGILRRELSIYGTWNSEYRNIPLNEWELTLDFMSRGLIEITPLISHRFGLQDVSAVFDMMYHKTEIFHRVFFIP